MNLQTKYMGLTLKNPIIIGSSSLTNSVESIKKLANNNAGAVVLKSLFEEQIINEINKPENSNLYNYPESIDYIRHYTREQNISNYLKLIEDSKKAVDIPIIASINCISDKEWIAFAKRIEDAGADALELNVSILPSDFSKSSEENESVYFNIVEKLKSVISIPLSLKMTRYSAGLAQLIQKLSWTKKVDAFVLFNRYYNPDIDIEKMEVVSSNVFSTAEEISVSLRWIALLSNDVKCDFAATTGIHNGEGVIKQILAGAKTVQIVSSIYKNGPEYISTILNDVEKWMKNKNFNSLDDFRGKMSDKKEKHAADFERIQFMKYFGGVKK